MARRRSLRVSLSRRRHLLVRRLPAELLVVALVQLVLLVVVPVALRVPVPPVGVLRAAQRAAQRARVLRLVALWVLGSPRGRRSWVPVWARPGAWPISPLATPGRPRWLPPALRDRRERKASEAHRAEGALVAVGVVSQREQRERERCIGDERCC